MPKLIVILERGLLPPVSLSVPKDAQQIAALLLNQLLRKVEHYEKDASDHLFFQAALHGEYKRQFPFRVVEDKDIEDITLETVREAYGFGRWELNSAAFVYHFDKPSEAKEVEKKLLSRSMELESIKNITVLLTEAVVVLNAAEVVRALPAANMSFYKLKDLNDRAVISGATTAKWQPFFERIQEMEEYGKKLLSKGVKEKGELVCKLADDTRDQAIALLQHGEPISEVSLRDFKQTVHNMLTDKNTHDLLAEHRPGGASWKVVTGNVLLALTGIGAIALAIQLIYSKAKTGHYLLFGSPTKTTSEEKAEKVDEAINRLN